MQEFNLDKSYITLMKGCLIAFVSFIALGVALPFLPDEGKVNTQGTLITSIMCIVVFGSFAILTWVSLKKLPYADIVTDDDGLWYKHKRKEQDLVPWGSIAKVKERSYMQCLDVLDSSGSQLIRAEYQLNDFETLRNLLNERVSQTSHEELRTHFSKSIFYHIFYVSCVIGFSWLGLYVGNTDNPVVGYVGMSIVVVMIVYEYLVTAYRLIINERGVIVSYPLSERSVNYSDITNIEVTDTFHKGARHPEVRLNTSQGKKPYRLKKLGVDANVLYLALHKAMEHHR